MAQLPAKQDQYVKYAEKDSKGRNIADEVDNIEAKANAPLMENIVDSEGHKRFQEWDLTPSSNPGITMTYAKASLSGTHFMVVIAGDLANEAVFGNGETLASINNLPDWILSKIVPVWGDVWVERKETNAYAADWTVQSFFCGLNKSSNYLGIGKLGALTLNADRKFRIQFDLLID